MKSRQQQQCEGRRKHRRLNQNKGEEQGNVQEDEFYLAFMSKSTYDDYRRKYYCHARCDEKKNYPNSWLELREW